MSMNISCCALSRYLLFILSIFMWCYSRDGWPLARLALHCTALHWSLYACWFWVVSVASKPVNNPACSELWITWPGYTLECWNAQDKTSSQWAKSFYGLAFSCWYPSLSLSLSLHALVCVCLAIFMHFLLIISLPPSPLSLPFFTPSHSLSLPCLTDPISLWWPDRAWHEWEWPSLPPSLHLQAAVPPNPQPRQKLWVYIRFINTPPTHCNHYNNIIHIHVHEVRI